MNISINISGKINPLILDILKSINTVAGELSVPFFLVGAMVRDIIYEYHYGIKTTRATKDIDIGIRILDISKFSLFIDSLINKYSFEKTNLIHRIRKYGIQLDIIPFGQVAGNNFQVAFPGISNIITVLGFEEAYSNSLEVLICDNPILNIKIPFIPSLVAMKLISWDDKYPDRGKDAKDIIFMLKNYEDLKEIKDRLYEIENFILREEGFDLSKASIRLLGKDITKIFDKNTLVKIRQIITTETSDDAFKLVKDMSENPIHDNEDILAILRKLKQGLFNK